MKKIFNKNQVPVVFISLALITAIVAALINYPKTAKAAVAYVQSASNVEYFNSDANVSASFSSNVTAGNLIAVFVSWSDVAATVSSVTDSCGNSYSLVGSPVAGSGFRAQGAYAKNVVGGSACAVTAVFSVANSNKTIAVHEISGLDSSSPLDGNGGASTAGGAGTDTISSGNFTTATVGDYIFGAMFNPDQHNTLITAGTGFTGRVANNANNVTLTTEEKVQALAGSVAVNFSTNGFASAIVIGMAFKPFSGPPDTTAPSVPANLSATAVSSSAINLAWAASTDAVGVTGYKIYRNGSLLTTVSPPLTTFSDTGLTASTNYSYTVSAYDAAGNTSSQSSSASATTQSPPPPDATAPSVPANLSASAMSSSQINLSWIASTDNVGVIGYKIYRAGSQIGTSVSNSYSDSNLSPSTLYSYTVSAYDAAGNASSQSTSASATTQAAPSNDLIPQDRLIDWAQIGVIAPDGSRGIPTFPDCTAYTVTANNTASVQTALNNCPVRTTVNVPAGTYGAVNITRSVVLKGAGPNKTIFTGIISVDKYNGGYGGTITPRSWVGGLSKGSTNITISGSVAGLTVGQTIGLDQLNDPNLVNIVGSQGGVDASLSTLSRNGTSWEGGTNRAMFQLNRVKACGTSVSGAACTSNTITLDVPVYIDHSAGLSPEVFWWGTNLEYAGVENLTVDAAAIGGPAVPVYWCTNCWVQNIEVKNPGRNGVSFKWYSFRGEIRNSWIHDSQGGSANCGPQRYGVELGWVSAVRIENNIIHDICAPIETGLPVSGNLIVYNYIGPPKSLWMFAGMAEHAAHTYFNLFEGNYAQSTNSDNVWGSGSHGTIFRNRFTGTSPDAINQRVAVILDKYHRNYNIVGNVLGTVGINTTYQFDSTLVGHDLGIYALGYRSSAQPDTISFDPATLTTLLRWGNWDSATNAIRWNTSERPEGLDVSHNLPASLIYNSQPSYWGSLAWPAFGPNPNSPATLLNATIPALQCYQNQNLASGGIFTPSTCYGASGSGDTTAPSVPSGLSATAVSTSQVNLSWTSSTDNVGVTGYRIYRGGVLVGTTITNNYNDNGLNPSTLYSYTVSAYDAAGNSSSQSASSSATTQSGTPIAGDLNLDHIVNALDYSLLNSKWLQSFSAYDLQADGLINSLDFAILSSNWGRTW